ncbi:Uncharacterised protein [BD1-7 clade bacterium]|uniref:Bacterial Ig-like domain-containing protein n=1 Tax=BD1-7 clade bacterium TaxID=2029982 RepID=A0A5S9Q5X7_9GAMM|nr:Uncharacterised protein [BD1-7 clade bacterium]
MSKFTLSSLSFFMAFSALTHASGGESELTQAQVGLPFHSGAVTPVNRELLPKGPKHNLTFLKNGEPLTPLTDTYSRTELIFPIEQTFKLHSNPQAPRKLYLWFKNYENPTSADGLTVGLHGSEIEHLLEKYPNLYAMMPASMRETVETKGWTATRKVGQSAEEFLASDFVKALIATPEGQAYFSNPNRPFLWRAHDVDGDTDYFNTEESAVIQKFFMAASAFYAPYEIDITTETPSPEDLARTSADDDSYGVRVLISYSQSTPNATNDWDGLDLSVIGQEKPIQAPTGGYATPNTTFHEFGHNLGNGHHPVNTSDGGYFIENIPWGYLKGPGNTSARSMMGARFYDTRAVSTPFEVQAISPNIQPRVDDFANTIDDAAPLLPAIDQDLLIRWAVIEHSSDIDVFTFTLDYEQQIHLKIEPVFHSGVNLNTTLLASSGTVIETQDFHGDTDSQYRRNLPAGEYYLTVKTSKYEPLTGSCWKVGESRPTSTSQCKQGTGSHEYGALGPYTVSLATSDDIRGIMPARGNMQVRADRFLLNGDAEHELDVLANDRFETQARATISLLTLPKHGTAQVSHDNTIIYQPDANYLGMDDWAYSVTINDKVQSERIHITIATDADTLLANDDFKLTFENHPVKVDVLSNDFALNDTLKLVAISSEPQHGRVEIALDGTLVYHPDVFYSGTVDDIFQYVTGNRNNLYLAENERIDDEFSYVVSNGMEETTATVRIAILNNEFPSIAIPDHATTPTNVPTNIHVFDNDIVATINPITNKPAHSIRHFSQPQFGRVRSIGNNTQGIFEYTPDSGFCGEDRFSYQSSDTGDQRADDVGDVFISVVCLAEPDETDTGNGNNTVNLLSIQRHEPLQKKIPEGTTTFYVQFSTAVQNVDVSDFALQYSTSSGQPTNDKPLSSLTAVTQIASDLYAVDAQLEGFSAINDNTLFTGRQRLVLKASADISNADGQLISQALPLTHEFYIVDERSQNNFPISLVNIPQRISDTTAFTFTLNSQRRTKAEISSFEVQGGTITEVAKIGVNSSVDKFHVTIQPDGTGDVVFHSPQGALKLFGSLSSITSAALTHTIQYLPNGVGMSSIERHQPSEATTSQQSLVYNVQFAAPVTNVSAASFSATGITNATVTGVDAQNTSTYRVSVSVADGESGDIGLTLSAAHGVRVADASQQSVQAHVSGNNDTFMITFNPNPPLLQSIQRSDSRGAFVNDNELMFDITFSKAVTLSADDIALHSTGGAVTLSEVVASSVTGSRHVATVAVPENFEGTIRLGIKGTGTEPGNNTIRDTNNQPLLSDAAEQIQHYRVDNSAPALTINAPVSAASGLPFTVTLSFDDEVSDFSPEDIQLTHATLLSLERAVPQVGHFIAQIEAGDTGPIMIQVADSAAVNLLQVGNSPAEVSIELDNQQPSVSLITPEAVNPGGIAEVILDFSEAIADFERAAIALTNARITQLRRLDADSYKVTLQADDNATDTVTINLVPQRITDVAGQPILPASATIAVSSQVPTVTLSDASNLIALNETSDIMLDFSVGITGLTVDDFVTTGLTITELSQTTPSNYTLKVIATDSLAVLKLPQGAVESVVGNKANELFQHSWVAKEFGPRLTHTDIPDVVNGAFTVTLTFDEAIVPLTTDSIQVRGGQITALENTDSTLWHAAVTPDGSRTTITFDVQKAQIRSLADNKLALKPITLTTRFDNVAPSFVIRSSSGNLEGGTLVLEFSEPVRRTGNIFSIEALNIGDPAPVISSGAYDGSDEPIERLIVNFYAPTQESLRLTINGGFEDLAGNPSAGSLNTRIHQDIVTPTLSFSALPDEITDNQIFSVIVNASETIGNVDADALSIDNAQRIDVMCSGSRCDIRLRATGLGNIHVRVMEGFITDQAGNPNLAQLFTSIDANLPQPVLSWVNAPEVIGIAPKVLRLQSNTSITGLTSNDIGIQGGSITDFNAINNTEFDITVQASADTAQATLTIAAGAAQSSDNSLDSLAVAALVLNVDAQNPTISQFERYNLHNRLVNTEQIQWLVHFNEAQINTQPSDWQLSDASALSAPLTVETFDTNVWLLTAPLVADFEGEVRLTLASNHDIHDAAGNRLTNAAPLAPKYNVVRTGIIANWNAFEPVITQTNFVLTLAFNEPPLDPPSAPDFILENAQVNAIEALDNRRFRIRLRAQQDTAIKVELKANTVSFGENVKNRSTGAAELTLDLETSEPTPPVTPKPAPPAPKLFFGSVHALMVMLLGMLVLIRRR